MPEPKFEMGRLVITAALQHDLEESDTEKDWHDEINLFVSRHLFGDWGDVDTHDGSVNDRAVVNGDRVVSAYTTTNGIKIWVITEWDRSVTTLLRPEDY